MRATRKPSTRIATALRTAALVVAAVGLLLASGCLRGPVALNTPAANHSGSAVVTTTATSGSVLPPLAGKVVPPAAGAYLGIYRPPAPYQMSGYDSYANVVSTKMPAILMWYQQWAQNSPHELDSASCVLAYQRGAIPMVTWEPWDPGTNANSLKTPSIQPQFRLARIIDGSFDPYIRRFARRAAALRGPLMLRLMHEMNGRWYPWGGTVNGNKPEEFVQAWRHVHDIFVHEGATNVTWVWSPNHESRPNTIENRYSVYYPGDAYVDWVAATGFNFGSTTPTSKWVSFEGNFAAPLAYLRTLGKPVMISEFGSVEQGGNKAAWMADALSRIRNDHPEIKAFVYFDSNEKGSVQSQDWRINSSPSSLTAFQKGIADPYFVGAPANTLSAWTNSLSNTDWSYLRSIQPLY